MTRYPLFHLGSPVAEERDRKLEAARDGFELAAEELSEAMQDLWNSRSLAAIDAAAARREQAFARARGFAREIDEIQDRDQLQRDCLEDLLLATLN